MRVRPKAVLVVLALLVLGVPPRMAQGQGRRQSRVLFVPAPSLPGPLRTAIPRLLSSRAQVIPREKYLVRTSRGRQSPSSTRAIRTHGTKVGADVIVVAGFYGRARRVRVLNLQFYDGRSGELIGRNTHRLRRVVLTPAARRSLLGAIPGGRSAARADRGGRAEAPSAPPKSSRRSRPAAEEEDEPAPAPRRRRAGRRNPKERVEAKPPRREVPEPAEVEPEEEEEEEEADEEDEEDWEDEEDDEEDLDDDEEDEDEDLDDDEYEDLEDNDPGGPPPFGVHARAGLGFGTRTSNVPTENGLARLSTTPFPAGHLEVNGIWMPGGEGGTRWRLTVSYATSLGLRIRDVRIGLLDQTVDARAHELRTELGGVFLLGDGARPLQLGVSFGYGSRILSTETPIATPVYALSGPYVRPGLVVPVGDGPLTVGVSPEFSVLTGFTEDLVQTAQVRFGFTVGGEVIVHYNVLDNLAAELTYRETHAIIGSNLADDMNDVQRWTFVRAVYTP